MAIWIVCYSLTGRTRAVFRALEARLGAQTVEITAPLVRPGLWALLRWGYGTLTGGRTPVRAKPIAFGPDDLLVLASPVWAGRVSVPMRCWLKNAQPLPARVALVLTSGDPRYPQLCFERLTVLAGRAPVALLHVSRDNADADTFAPGLEVFAQALGAPGRV